MILGPDGAKLSKRHGAASVMEYREMGFLPEAVINYLVRLGWSHGDQEIFTLDEMIDLFDIADVNHSASAINPDKLLWLNHHYIKSGDPDHVARHLSWHVGNLGLDPAPAPALRDVVAIQRERSKTLTEMAQASTFFYRDVEDYDAKAADKNLTADALPVLRALYSDLSALAAWEAEPIHAAVNAIAERMELKLGKVAQPLRVAVSGGTVSPPIDQTLALLGRERTLARIGRAIEWIEQRGGAA
jgi:glutamyl-tRNA synthetase